MQLYTPVEIDQIQQDLPYLITIMKWVKSFLASPHYDLGRSGPVCPYVPYSLKSNAIQLAVIRTKNLNQQQIEEIVRGYKDIFLETEPQERETALNKAFLLIFPDLHIDDFTLIDRVQQKLKPTFVEAGLMIGEFHKQNNTPGLHNPNFRPLRSPIPILAIRFMVESDLPFVQNTEDLSLRIRYLQAYLKQFANKIENEPMLKNARQALSLAEKQIASSKNVRTPLGVVNG